MTNGFSQVAQKAGSGFAHILDRTIIGEITWDSVVGMPSDPRAAFTIVASYVSFVEDDKSPTGSAELRLPYSPVWWSVPGERSVHFIITNVRDNPDISGNPGAQPDQQPFTEVIVTLNKGVDWEHGGEFASHIVSKRIVDPPLRHFRKEPGPAYTSFVVTLGPW